MLDNLKKYWKIEAAAVFMTAAGLYYGFFRGAGDGQGLFAGSGEEILLSAEDGDSAAEVLNGVSGGKDSVSPADGAGTDGMPDGAFKAPADEESDGRTAGVQSTAESEAPPVIYVHVCGEVENPGVYELPEGSRAFEALEAAGGFTEQAAADCLNLAAVVSDGMQLRVLTQAEAEGLSMEEIGRLTGQEASGSSSSSDGPAPVNINTAGKEELMTLSGIGESRAGDIIRYRTENGGFKKIEEIKNVPGIKDAMFQKIKDSITV